MALLIAGLIIFLGMHSVRIYADDWRGEQIARLGESGYKGIFSAVSAIGLVLIVLGYGAARGASITIWEPPLWARHVAALLMLFSFVLIAAAYVPHNRIKPAVGHPMVLGVKIWAAGHLLANGHLEDLLLFGSFLVWAVANFRSARSRDRRGDRRIGSGTTAGNAAAIVVGAAVWALFAFYLHARLIGVSPVIRP